MARERPWTPEQTGAGRDHTDADLGKAETRLRRGDHHVAGQHDLEPAPEREPLDRGDERLAPLAPDDPVLAAALGHVVAAAGQVAPGAEHLAGARQDAGPELQIVVELVQGFVELVGHGAVDGVALLGPIERDHEHVSGSPAPYERGGGIHQARPLWCGTPSNYPPAELSSSCAARRLRREHRTPPRASPLALWRWVVAPVAATVVGLVGVGFVSTPFRCTQRTNS